MANEIVPYSPNEEGVVIYRTEDNTLQLDVQVADETVWLTQEQMSQLFERDRTVIGRHIRNIFSEGELDESLVCAKFALPKKYGRRGGYIQAVEATVYNLDVIISVGYRVKSQAGTRFRQWATKIIKDYMLHGYAVNQRLQNIENQLASQQKQLAQHQEQIDFFVRTSLPPVEGIFYDGQIFDAYKFVSERIREAKKRIVLIDNYIDETVLAMLDKRSKDVTAKIYTKNISRQLSLDFEKHNAQYTPIEVEQFDRAHDRFLCIDDTVYLVGASIKDLGKKWFGFVKLEQTTDELLSKM